MRPRVRISTCLVVIAVIAGLLAWCRFAPTDSPALIPYVMGTIILTIILAITVTMLYAIWH